MSEGHYSKGTSLPTSEGNSLHTPWHMPAAKQMLVHTRVTLCPALHVTLPRKWANHVPAPPAWLARKKSAACGHSANPRGPWAAWQARTLHSICLKACLPCITDCARNRPRPGLSGAPALLLRCARCACQPAAAAAAASALRKPLGPLCCLLVVPLLVRQQLLRYAAH